MRTTYKKTVTEKKEYDIVTANCLICNKKSDDVDAYDGSIVWKDNMHTEISTNITLKEKTSYRDGSGSCKMISFDVCNVCFKEKLIIVLKACGLKPEEYTKDW